MLIDIIKATDTSNLFPGANPTIVENALYYKEINTLANSIAYSSILFVGLLASIFSLNKISFSFKARQAVEKKYKFVNSLFHNCNNSNYWNHSFFDF